MSKKRQPSGKRPKRVLAVMLEFDKWSAGRTWSYLASYALLDGFEACDMEWTVLPSLFGYADPEANPWVEARESLLAGETFDQAWVWLTHPHYPPDFWPWLERVAPVRVGVFMESLRYTPEEIAAWSGFGYRFAAAARQMRHLTHAVSFDESDAAELAATTGRPGRVIHSMMPADMVREVAPPPAGKVLFLGSLYGKREAFLSEAGLGDRVEMLASPDDGGAQAEAFDAIHHQALEALAQGRMTREGMHDLVLQLRAMRRAMLEHVLDLYRDGMAVLNLPAYFKGFPGRVAEAQAAGVPVLTNRPIGRPQTEAAYVHGRDILYYDVETPSDLAGQIDTLTADQGLRERLVVNARARLLQSMTSQAQMADLQAWVARTSKSSLRRRLEAMWPLGRKEFAVRAVRDDLRITPLDRRKDVRISTGLWSQRALGGPAVSRLVMERREFVEASFPEPWAIGLASPVGDLLVGGADWLVLEASGLTVQVRLLLVEAATGAVRAWQIASPEPDGIEIWLQVNGQADTLVVQACEIVGAPIRLGELRAVRDRRAPSPHPPKPLPEAVIASLERGLQTYRIGERRWPPPHLTDPVLRNDGLNDRLLSVDPATRLTIPLLAQHVIGSGNTSATQQGKDVVLSVPAAAPWSYLALIDLRGRLPEGRQSLVLQTGAVACAFGVALADRDHSGFIERWMAPAGLDSLEIWFEIIDPDEVSMLVLQHGATPFEGELVLKNLSTIRLHESSR